MTNKKHKHKELLKSRMKRLKALGDIDTCDQTMKPPVGSVIATHTKLAHNNTYGPLPFFYTDKLVVCRDCGKEEVWTARQQKWWYCQVLVPALESGK